MVDFERMNTQEQESTSCLIIIGWTVFCFGLGLVAGVWLA